MCVGGRGEVQIPVISHSLTCCLRLIIDQENTKCLENGEDKKIDEAIISGFTRMDPFVELLTSRNTRYTHAHTTEREKEQQRDESERREREKPNTGREMKRER